MTKGRKVTISIENAPKKKQSIQIKNQKPVINHPGNQKHPTNQVGKVK